MPDGKRLTVSLILSVGWVALSIMTLMISIATASNSNIFITLLVGIMAFIIGLFTTYGITGLLENPRQAMPTRRERIARVLHELDDDDLDALRERLSSPYAADGEYGSLDELLTEKRKHDDY